MIIMIQKYREKIFILLSIFLFTFATLFVVSMISTTINLIDIGLPNDLENNIISFFSFLAIIFIVWDIKKL